jgi:hypothetical protein
VDASVISFVTVSRVQHYVTATIMDFWTSSNHRWWCLCKKELLGSQKSHIVILFKDAGSCEDIITFMMDGWMSAGH